MNDQQKTQTGSAAQGKNDRSVKSKLDIASFNGDTKLVRILGLISATVDVD